MSGEVSEVTLLDMKGNLWYLCEFFGYGIRIKKWFAWFLMGTCESLVNDEEMDG